MTNCECCKKKLEYTMGQQKYCVNCSLFIRNLKQRFCQLEVKIRKLEARIKDLKFRLNV